MRLVHNVLSNWVAYGVNLVVSFFMAPFLIHRLGDASYGLWVLLGSLTGYLGLLDLGFRIATVRFISRYRALDDREAVNETYSTLFFGYAALGVVAFGLSGLFSHDFVRWFSVPAGSEAEASVSMFIMGGNVALSLIFGVYGGILGGGVQRYDVYNGVDIGILLVRTVAIVAVVAQGGGLLALSVITTGSAALGYGLRAVLSYRYCPGLRLRLSACSLATLRTVFGYSAFVFISGAARTIHHLADSVLIGAYVGAASITAYAVASRLISYAHTLVSNVIFPLGPVFSELDARMRTQRVREVMVWGNRAGALCAFPAGLILALGGADLLRLWIGPAYQGSAVFLTILVVPLVSSATQTAGAAVLYGVGRLQAYAAVRVAVAAASIGLGVWMIQRHGLVGLAVALAGPAVAADLIFFPAYICRVVEMPVWDYWRDTFVLPILCLVPAAVVHLGLSGALGEVTWSGFVLRAAAVGAVYAGSAWVVLLPAAARVEAKSRAREVVLRWTT